MDQARDQARDHRDHRAHAPTHFWDEIEYLITVTPPGPLQAQLVWGQKQEKGPGQGPRQHQARDQAMDQARDQSRDHRDHRAHGPTHF